MLHITEVLRHGQPGFCHTHTGAGRLVHLAKDQGCLLQHAALAHFVPQIVTLTGTLAYAGKDGVTAVLGGYIGDQLLDQHRFTYAGAAEQTDFTALLIGGQQVDNLDTGLQNLHIRGLVLKAGGLPVNAPVLLAA